MRFIRQLQTHEQPTGRNSLATVLCIFAKPYTWLVEVGLEALIIRKRKSRNIDLRGRLKNNGGGAGKVGARALFEDTRPSSVYKVRNTLL